MRTLVIDCATEACSVALFDSGALIAGELRMLGRGHAEQLVGMIAALPDKGRAQRIAVALGPGSFTGVRVGLAASRALALVWRSELVGYPTLTLVAAMARRTDEPLTVAMTGGHGEWFVSHDGGEAVSLAPAQAVAQARHRLVAGSQADALVALRGWGEAVPLWPDARAFVALPEAEWTPDVRPVYGRGPDARLPS